MTCNSEDILDSDSEHNYQMFCPPLNHRPPAQHKYSTIHVTMWGLETAILLGHDRGPKILGLCLSENLNINWKRMNQV